MLINIIKVTILIQFRDNLKKQDEKIDEIKKDIKKNITLAKNATHTMKEQNKTGKIMKRLPLQRQKRNNQGRCQI